MKKTKSLKSTKILLIERNKENIDLAVQGLAETRFSTDLRIVINGEEALDFLFQRGMYQSVCCPDFLILNPTLSDCDGFDLAREIRTTPQTADMPIVLLTDEETEEEGVARCSTLTQCFLISLPLFLSCLHAVRSVDELMLTLRNLHLATLDGYETPEKEAS